MLRSFNEATSSAFRAYHVIATVFVGFLRQHFVSFRRHRRRLLRLSTHSAQSSWRAVDSAEEDHAALALPAPTAKGMTMLVFIVI
jgi:hypothetical protein